MARKYKIEIKWAFIFMASLLLWMLLERLFGLHDKHIDKHMYLTMLYIIPAVWIYVLALKEKKNKFYKAQMSFKQGLISGLIISVIVTVFSPLTQWITSEIITPYYFDNVIAYSVEHGYDTLEEAQGYFSYKNYAIQSTIWAFGMGIITTLIVAFFVRTKK